MNIIRDYSNKEVSFRYKGKNLSFFLSQALFSSYDIDRGTRLLLKTIAENPPCTFKTVLDAGCGTGVLGIALKAADPDIRITMQDRDSLAVRFAAINAEKNGIADAEVMTALAFDGLSGRIYDLVVSNLPAKAGRPVLEHFIRRSLGVLSDSGCGAVVVVDPLKREVENMLKLEGAGIIYTESTDDYTVFHYKNRKTSVKPEPPDSGQSTILPYIRKTSGFTVHGISYTLKTAYNIPGFDTVPYSAAVMEGAAAKYPPRGRIFIWNPGQGHIPLILCLHGKTDIEQIVLASRDLLQVTVSGLNMKAAAGTPEIKTSAEPDALSALKGDKYNWIVIDTLNSYDKKMLKEIMEKGSELLEEHGFIAFTGKSSLLSDITGTNRRLRKIGVKKHRGFRMLLFQNSN